MFSEWEANAHYEQFLLFPVFSKLRLLRERDKHMTEAVNTATVIFTVTSAHPVIPIFCVLITLAREHLQTLC